MDSMLHRLLLYTGIILFIASFILVSFSRHDHFYSRRLDLGAMDQTVWNVVNGNGFTLTDPWSDRQQSRLAQHADFLLLLLAPLYVFWSNPKMLLAVQTIVLGLGALPMYWIANEKIKSKTISLLFASAYLLYPPMERTALHDFHSIALSTTFLLFAYWYMHKKNYVHFGLFALLAALGKEQVWLVTGLMGWYIAFIQKRRGIGVLVAAVSFSMFYYVFWVAIPAATLSGRHFALQFLSDFGYDVDPILKNIFLQPFTVIGKIVAPDRLYYFFQLLIPTGLLSLFAPAKLLFALPGLAINSLSSNAFMREIEYQYSSDITPFVFITAIEGYRALTNLLVSIKVKSYRASGVVAVVLLLATATTSYLWGELPIGMNTRYTFFLSPHPDQDVMESVERMIPSGYSVSVTDNIGSHFSQRQFLYNFPINARTADFTIVQLGDPYTWPIRAYQMREVEILMKSTTYELIARKGNFYAFRKKS